MNSTIVIGGELNDHQVEWTFDTVVIDENVEYVKVPVSVGDASFYVYKLSSLEDEQVLEYLLFR